MYEEHYGFAQSPFTLTPDPRFLYLSESHHEAIRLLLQSIRRKEGFIVLTGDIGTGKTTLCRALLQQLDRTTFTSLILDPFLSVEELLREILLDFGVVSREAVRTGGLASASKHQLAGTLHDFLVSLVPLHGSGVLIIDEAQHLAPQVLEEIRVLSNLETSESTLLQIVLVGQLNLLQVLAGAGLRQLDQRISLRAMLRPLTREGVDAYVSHRLAVARGSSPVSFDAPAIAGLHAVSHGVPRVINLLCDRALMFGARAGATVITSALIEEAAAALALKRTPAPPPRTRWRRLPRWGWLLAALLLIAALVLWFVPLRGLFAAAPPSPPVRPSTMGAAPPPSPPAPSGSTP